MPNRDYVNGRAAEHRAKQRLEARGYTVFRTAGSKTLSDLIAIAAPKLWGADAAEEREFARRRLVFCQVKNGVRPMPRKQREAFREFALKHGARPLLIERGNKWSWLDEPEEQAA